jgi:glyoxylase-like metal-dependent hydrolase (beta-lactamase superfamily II)
MNATAFRAARILRRTISLAMWMTMFDVSMATRAQSPPFVGDQATKVSEHVWSDSGFPNIGIVIGKTGVLVVDTGLGPRNGRTIADMVAHLAPSRKLYLTTTHFHPEHAAGEAGFPITTVLIRDRIQQEELDAHGKEMLELFSSRSQQQADLLADATFRKPDITFDSEYRLDLGGGVQARLLWFGGAHTRGDELVFVNPDRTLISGDVIQNKVVPNISPNGGTPTSWISVLDQIEKLNPSHVLPDHSAPGSGDLVAQEREFIVDLRNRTLLLKQRGLSAEAAADQVLPEIKSRFADWPITSVAGFVRSIYADTGS